MALIGTMYRPCPARTIMPSENSERKRQRECETRPLASGIDVMPIRPPRSWILRWTTSIPTALDPTSDTAAAVEKPGAKIIWSISSLLRTASAATMPLIEPFEHAHADAGGRRR
ncbi:MAG: hypothetical protein R3C97_02415 [Geminicoccaceae bacterium]